MLTRALGSTTLQVCEMGLGGATLEFPSHPEQGDVLAEAVLQVAWDAGLRYFDTAPHYGLGISERRIGRFLSQRPRKDFVLSTKVGRLIVADSDNRPKRQLDYSYDGIMRSLEDSLARLGLDSVDILFVHDIALGAEGDVASRHFSTLMDSGWRALEALRSSGAIRAFGLGVNEVEICHEVLARASVDVILLAGRYTLLDPQAAETGLLDLCRRRQTSIVLGGVFNTGILATGAVPGALFQYRPASEEMLARTRLLQQACETFGVPLAAAALQFAKGHPVVPTILNAASDPVRLRTNIADYQFPIPPEFWHRLNIDRLAHHYSLDLE